MMASVKIEEQVTSVYVSLSPSKKYLLLFESQEWISLWSNLEETYSAAISLASDKQTLIRGKVLLITVKESIQKL